ncbi:MAG: nicotinamide riboside transporter PnuC [Verrucomicrobiota bacterium]
MFETIIEQVAAITVTEFVGVISGLLAVWLSIKNRVLAWPIFIICYVSYALLSWEARLLPSIGMNAIFVGLSGYGWIQWSKSEDSKEAAGKIVKAPKTAWMKIVLVCLLSTAAFGSLFGHYGAYLPYIDAFAASVALSAQWMLGRHYIETWVLWIISDLVYIGLWSAQAYWPTVGLFVVFVILAIKGLKDWKQQLEKGKEVN